MNKNLETKYYMYHTLTNDNGMTILFITYQMFAVVQKKKFKYQHTFNQILTHPKNIYTN